MIEIIALCWHAKSVLGASYVKSRHKRYETWKEESTSIVVDTLGCILAIDVSSARPHDTKLGSFLVTKVLQAYPSIQTFAWDKGYRGTIVNYTQHSKSWKNFYYPRT